MTTCTKLLTLSRTSDINGIFKSGFSYERSLHWSGLYAAIDEYLPVPAATTKHWWMFILLQPTEGRVRQTSFANSFSEMS